MSLFILYVHEHDRLGFGMLTLFRLGFFGQSVTVEGGPRTPPPPSVSLEPIMLIISVQRSSTPSFDLPRPMMTP